MTGEIRTADDVWREIQGKCRQHLEAKPLKPILTYEGVENFITGVGDTWIERHSASRRAVRETSRTPKSDVVKIWESLVQTGHTDEVRASYYFSYALLHRLIDGVAAKGASQLYFSDRDKAMRKFEPKGASELPVREQLLADLRAVQTGRHPLRRGSVVEESVDVQTQKQAALATWKAADTAARAAFPKGSADRRDAFVTAKAEYLVALHQLGVPYINPWGGGNTVNPKARNLADAMIRAGAPTEAAPAQQPGVQPWLHKPLLLLLCFGRCAHQEGRMIPFKEIEEELTELLSLYDPPGSSAAEPFWRLQFDGRLWVLDGEELDELRTTGESPTATWLRVHHVRGGLSKPYYDAVIPDRSLLSEAVNVVITTFLPEATWEQIRDRFGFSTPPVKTRVAGTGMTIELAMDESKRAFRKAQRDCAKGQARNEAFAAQARTFLDRLEALGAIQNTEIIVSPEELGAARYKDLVDYVRMAGKNIALAERLYGWTAMSSGA